MTRILTFIADAILACVAAFAWTMIAFLAVGFVCIAKVGDFAIKLISRPKNLSYHQHIIQRDEPLWETALMVSAFLLFFVLAARGVLGFLRIL